jgi:hypothetical protein
VRFEELFGRREGRGDRLAHLATAFNDFDKRWAVSQTLAIIAGRAAMKEQRDADASESADIGRKRKAALCGEPAYFVLSVSFGCDTEPPRRTADLDHESARS